MVAGLGPAAWLWAALHCHHCLCPGYSSRSVLPSACFIPASLLPLPHPLYCVLSSPHLAWPPHSLWPLPSFPACSHQGPTVLQSNHAFHCTLIKISG